jgi:hypothetical protein
MLWKWKWKWKLGPAAVLLAGGYLTLEYTTTLLPVCNGYANCT